MFFLKKPSDKELLSKLNTPYSFSYNEIGATQNGKLEKYKHNDVFMDYKVIRYRISLGFGKEVFKKAKEGFQNWIPFDLNWLTIYYPKDTTPQKGMQIGILTQLFGVKTYMIDNIIDLISIKDQNLIKTGFYYGTTEEHAEKGEERFLLEFDKNSNEVYYEILSFSKTNHFLAKVSSYFVRRLQHKFVVDSGKRMLLFTKK